MKKLKLNANKIRDELKRIDKTQTWLAEQVGTTRQSISEMLRNGSVRAAERIGHVLGIEPKDLIK